MLGRLQDTISEGGSDDVCNNGRVHQGLVFMVILRLSLSSFLTSTFCFTYLRVGGQAFSSLLWSGHLQAGKEVGWNWGGVSRSVLFCSVLADLPVQVVVFLY